MAVRSKEKCRGRLQFHAVDFGRLGVVFAEDVGGHFLHGGFQDGV